MTNRSLDPRNPWVLNIHKLIRRAGEMIEIHDHIAAPQDLGLDMIKVPEGSSIGVDLKLESVVEGVWVTGTIRADLEGQCARCLDPINDEGTYTIQELYYYPGKDAEDDALFIHEDLIDLEPAARDAIVLELPFSPLCQPDCLGMCDECGYPLNDDPAHSHEQALDPRWDALSQLGNQIPSTD